MEPFASYWDPNRSSADYTMSADEQTAYRTGTANGAFPMALSSISGTGNVYVEVTITFGPGSAGIGIANSNVNVNSGTLGGDTNNISMADNGSVQFNGASIGTGPGFASGDIVAIAVYGQLKLIQFRDVTGNSAWSPLFSIAQLGPPPYYLTVGLENTINSAYVNFYGPFVGALPTGSPAFTVWNPEILFSEQPVKVIDFDAVIADGSYTDSNPNDLWPMPFSYIKWGDAVLDAKYNLRFTDWVIDDKPIFSVILDVSGPANNYTWAAWDYGTPFLVRKVHIPGGTSTVALSNVEIPLPPPSTSPPVVGQGHVLQLFNSCDASALFSWSGGRVWGTEDALVYGPVEYGTYPPSVVGTTYIRQGGTVNANFPAYTPLFPPPLVGQGGGAPPTFPPPTPPPIGAIPPGILVGPAIQPSSVPPSVAGIAQPVFTYGSATTPPASAAFPEFTTTFPVPPIAFSNIFTDGVSPTVPPHSTSTPPLGGSYNTGGVWGPPIGPALPAVVPPRQFMAVAAEIEPETNSSLEGEPESIPDDEYRDEPDPPHRGRGRRRRK